MKAEDQYHVGLVVSDFDAELARLSELFGYTWGREITWPVPVRSATGIETIEFRLRYSSSTPRVELIEQRPGTVWTPVAGSGVHHLGYWSDDLAADGAELLAAGYSLEAEAVTDEGVPLFAYYGCASGPRIELVPRADEETMAFLWGPEA